MVPAMNLRTAIVLAVSLLAAACGGGLCAIACIPNVELALGDGSGAAMSPGTGTIAIAGTTTSFDCSKTPVAASTDAVIGVRCSANKLILDLASPSPTLDLSVTPAAGGAARTATVALTYQDTAPNQCGGTCREASQSVTLQ